MDLTTVEADQMPMLLGVGFNFLYQLRKCREASGHIVTGLFTEGRQRLLTLGTSRVRLVKACLLGLVKVIVHDGAELEVTCAVQECVDPSLGVVTLVELQCCLVQTVAVSPVFGVSLAHNLNVGTTVILGHVVGQHP